MSSATPTSSEDGPALPLRAAAAFESGATYVFGEYQLDLARFELRRDDARVPVQPKALRLLVYLVVRRERAVSSDELLARLWGGETVTHGSLKRAVRAARRALGEAGDLHSSVRTVRGYGYHFVRPVEVIVLRGAERAAGAVE